MPPQASARLEDEDGVEVPGWFSSPRQPANKGFGSLQRTPCACSRTSRWWRPALRRADDGGRRQKGDWARTWSFTTPGPTSVPAASAAPWPASTPPQQAGLQPCGLDETAAKGCMAHAAYVAPSPRAGAELRLEQERRDLEGYTPRGPPSPPRPAVRTGGGGGASDAVDWMDRVGQNRTCFSNPSLEKAGMGARCIRRAAGSGSPLVVSVAASARRAGADAPPDADEVPLYFYRDARELCPSIRGSAGRLRVTANFFVTGDVRRAKARLLTRSVRSIVTLDAGERLPGTGTIASRRHPKEGAGTEDDVSRGGGGEGGRKGVVAGVAVRDDGRRTPR